MRKKDTLWKKDIFNFHVQNLAHGWCRVLMLINDKEIEFNAEYMGPNPLASFIDACAGLMEEGEEYVVEWLYHDVVLRIEMELKKNDMLCFDITKREWQIFEADEKKENYNIK